MRRFREPAEVVLGQGDHPVRFTAWGRTYAVVRIEAPPWDEVEPWWTPQNAGREVEELRVRHYRVRAHGVRRNAVVELVEQAGQWHVVGVED
ncbi:hypothetical protein ACWEN6_13675 [Sphaerisporangium sp. NPDC004334]